MRMIAHVVTAGGLTVALAGFAAPACAEVALKTEAGFVLRVSAEVAASPADAWKAFTTPSLWWSAQHTFSGEAVNLTLDPVANGCFCEKLPVPKDALAAQKPGSVMHMRVVYAEPYRALRLVGGLGPLQSEAVNGTMTVTFKPVDGSGGKATRVLWEYVVGGFMRYKTEIISGAVDKVLEGQLAGLVEVLGPVKAAAAVPEPLLDEPKAAEPLVAEPVGEDAAPASEEPSFTPDPAKDEVEAGESVKTALDKLFPSTAKPLPEGR
ncbi:MULTISPECIES: SRPBCC family protein [unclassified Novosphingobium]|uniref:SRPBCC family protein n=1 Tax=unclassified Novosphingobium TaxID=2644732 RepID=UPI0025D2C96A|nr:MULTISPECIES: SRPBCC family protein [unclassified Novosphingobium]HQS71404.1 SRPBCC family protein [Novosphingobium sp.]